MSYSLYLFDFDYTLVNSEEGILKCFRLTLDAYARPQVPDDVIRKTIGLPMEEAVRRITGYEDAAQIDAFIEDYRHLADRYMTPGTHFLPDTLDVLRAFGAARQQTLYVGDSVVDAGAAQQAAVPFAAVLTGATPAAAFDAYPHVAICQNLRGLLTL